MVSDLCLTVSQNMLPPCWGIDRNIWSIRADIRLFPRLRGANDKPDFARVLSGAFGLLAISEHLNFLHRHHATDQKLIEYIQECANFTFAIQNFDHNRQIP